MAAASAFVLTGCTETDLSSDTSLAKESTPSAIEFSASTGNAGVTRTVVAQDYQKGAIGNTADGDFTKSLKQAHFGVFAYHTTSGEYDPAAPTALLPNFMYNQELKYDDAEGSGVNAWVYDPVKYWPNGVDVANAANEPSNTATEKNTNQKLSFFAYSPFMPKSDFTAVGSGTAGTDFPTALSAGTNFKTVASPTNGIVAMTTNEFTGNVWVKYLMPNAYENEAVDLLWGVRGQKIYSETDGNNNTVDALGDNYNINLTKQTVGEKVKFLFKHALTKISGQTVTEEDVTKTPDSGDKIGFKIVADVDVNTEATAGDHDNQAAYFGSGSDFDKTKTLITLKSIKIQDGKTASDDDETSVTGITESGIYNSGWFNIETGTWDNQKTTAPGSKIEIVAESKEANQTSDDDVNYSINPDIRDAASYGKYGGTEVKKLADGGVTWDDAKPTGISTTAVPVFAKENIPGIMLIPGAADQSIYITVDYLVRTADPNLSNGFTVVEQVISNKVSLASLKSNKYYTIIMHLGLTSVKFEAVVADWVTNNSSEFDEDGHVVDPATPTENESHIWLPSNVVYAKTTNSPYAATKGLTSTVYTPANTTSYEINVNGMTSGHTLEVTCSGGATLSTPATIDGEGKASVSVTLTENASNKNKLSTITITEKDGETVVSTTTVNIIQNPV